MSAPDTNESESTSRFRAHHIPFILGGGFALLTAASYIAELLWAEDWQHDYVADNPVSREMFLNIPSAFAFVFYLVTVLTILWGAFAFSSRMRNWERGAPENRRTTSKNVKQRAEKVRAGLYMQTLLRDPAAGVMHSLMYFSFIVLLAVTTIGEINLQVPESMKFLHGDVYRAYALIADLAGIAFLIGVGWAIVRRYIQ